MIESDLRLARELDLLSGFLWELLMELMLESGMDATKGPELELNLAQGLDFEKVAETRLELVRALASGQERAKSKELG